ncbi:hypothetical protein KAT92_05405 [Candidatus Babeliales bacterium]|nr:hypothetical protein [Candidatus Babeliales bacterium]
MKNRMKTLLEELPSNGVLELNKVNGGITRRVLDIPFLLIGLGLIRGGHHPLPLAEDEKGMVLGEAFKKASALSTNAAGRKAAKIAISDGTKLSELPSKVKAAIAESKLRESLEITSEEWKQIAAFARKAIQNHEKITNEQDARSSYQRPSGGRMVFTAIK